MRGYADEDLATGWIHYPASELARRVYPMACQLGEQRQPVVVIAAWIRPGICDDRAVRLEEGTAVNWSVGELVAARG